MANYTITNFNSENGQITLAFDGIQKNFSVPLVDGAFTSGAALTSLLDSYVENAKIARQAITSTNASDILALVATPSAGQLDAANKVNRDILLLRTDWTTLADSPLSAELVAQWKAYRQSLRDLPASTGWPTNIVWPIPPATVTNQTGTALTDASGSPTMPARIVW